MESVSSINECTELSPTDIDYIARSFIPPAVGGKVRGKKKGWLKQSKVEFAIVKRYMDYGITIKTISDIIKSLRENTQWKELFENGNLKSGVLKKGSHSYLYLRDADPLRVELILNKTQEIFGLKSDWKSILILDVTEVMLLAVPGE